MKRLILYIIIAMPLHIGLAQTIISGTVKNAETGTSIEQVTVYFPEMEKGTATNEMGKYELMDVPSGSSIIVFSSIGFETFSKTININIGTNTLDVILTPSAIEMEEVIVSTPFHKLQSENVMKVERANMKELKTVGAVTLSDGITKIAGVESVS